MPGPYIHISSMTHTAASLSQQPYQPVPSLRSSNRINPQWTGLDTVNLGQIMQNHLNFANLGAIGPDLFFFLPDFRNEKGIVTSSVLVTVLNFLETVYGTLDPYISKWEKYLGPLSEDTAEEMSRLTGGLSETVGNISGELGGIVITALENYVVGLKDWWEFFSLGLNKGYDERVYFWSDMLHYRETEKFGRAIWKYANEENDDRTRAYALGYITHLATDVTGHAFVNSISGGPFRLHWQRHHLVENHMDAYWYLKDSSSPRNGSHYPQLTESALYYNIAFGPEGEVKSRPSYPTGGTLRENWQRRRMLDTDSKLFDKIPKILIAAMTDVFYNGEKHPTILRNNEGRPSEELISNAYDLFFRFLKFTTVDGFSHEPPLPPDVFPNLDFPTPTDPSSSSDEPPDDGGGGGGGSFWDDLFNLIMSIVHVIGYILEVALYLATLPWAILTDITTYPLRLGLYYALQLPLFHILKSFRYVLVKTGFLLPMEDEIIYDLIHIGPSSDPFKLVIKELNDIFGGIPIGEPNPQGGETQTFRDPNYPYYHPNIKGDEEYRHPWQYPSQNATKVPREDPPTTSGPYAQDIFPDVLFEDIESDPTIRDNLEKATTSKEADDVGLTIQPTHHLGDCVSFSKYLIWLESRSPIQDGNIEIPLVQWNLDSDRGYGYHCWDWNRDSEIKYDDGSGQSPPFLQPCTWPQQVEPDGTGSTDDSLWKKQQQQPKGMEIHWVPGEDPHCPPIPDVPTPIRDLKIDSSSLEVASDEKISSPHSHSKSRQLKENNNRGDNNGRE